MGFHKIRGFRAGKDETQNQNCAKNILFFKKQKLLNETYCCINC